MRHSRTPILALIVVLLVPALASATHIEELVASADCEGWQADVTIRWRTGVFEGGLEYTIQLQDADGAVLDVATWVGPVTRGEDDPVMMQYSFSGDWTEPVAEADLMIWQQFYLIALYPDGVEEDTVEAEAAVDCNVPVEGASWSDVRSSYR